MTGPSGRVPMRLPFAAFALLALPASADAQVYGPPAPGEERPPSVVDARVGSDDRTLGQDLDEARERIKRQRESGAISKREARALRREAGLIGELAARYGADGLSDDERRELEMRAQVLRAEAALPPRR